MTEIVQEGILEKSPNQFTVCFGGKHFGYFTTRVGAMTFLDMLKDIKKEEIETTWPACCALKEEPK